MILALATKTQMKYRGVYLINIYSYFFPEIFLILQFAKIYPRITWVFDLGNVSVTKVFSIKDDEIKIKMGVYM